MKSRNCFGAFIAAILLGSTSHSQIRDGKYVFNNETVVTAISSHIFMKVDLAEAKAVSNALLQEIVNNRAVKFEDRIVERLLLVSRIDSLMNVGNDRDGLEPIQGLQPSIRRGHDVQHK